MVPLALVVFCMIQTVAFRKKGFWYFGHVFKPFPALLPINVLDEILRPITLAARLFFNIFVGELLFIIITSIIVARINIGFFNLSLGVTVVPILIQFFNFFVGTIQAFVFTLLAIVYLSLATWRERLIRKVTSLTSEALVAASTLICFGIIVAGVAFGSAVGDGIVAARRSRRSRANPRRGPNIFLVHVLGRRRAGGVTVHRDRAGLLHAPGRGEGARDHHRTGEVVTDVLPLDRRDVLSCSCSISRFFSRCLTSSFCGRSRRAIRKRRRVHRQPRLRLRSLSGRSAQLCATRPRRCAPSAPRRAEQRIAAARARGLERSGGSWRPQYARARAAHRRGGASNGRKPSSIRRARAKTRRCGQLADLMVERSHPEAAK